MNTTLCMFVMFFVGAGNALAEEVDRRRLRALEELTTNVAKSILDPAVVVVIAESRYDIILRDPEERFPGSKKMDAIAVLSLNPLVPVEYLRGMGNSELIYVQIDYGGIVRSRRPIYYVPRTSTEGTWLYFLRHVERLPSFTEIANSEISNELQKIDAALPPLEVAKQFGLDSWLRRDTWFELAAPITAYPISYTVRDLKISHEYADFSKAQVQKMGDNWRSLAEKRREKSKDKEIILTTEQIAQIEVLVKMFPADGSVPDIDALISMRSPFADAILKELAKRASEPSIANPTPQYDSDSR